MSKILSEIELLCDKADGLAGLISTVAAAASTTGIDPHALTGLSYSAQNLARDLEELRADIHFQEHIGK